MAQSEYQSSKEGTIKVPVIAGLDQRSEQGRMNLGNFTEIGSNYQKYQHNLSHLPESFFNQKGTYPSLTGHQRRLLGKNISNNFSNTVFGIFQFWSPYGYSAGITQTDTNVDYNIWLSSSQDFSSAIPPINLSYYSPIPWTPFTYDNPTTPSTPTITPTGWDPGGKNPDQNPDQPYVNDGLPPFSGPSTDYSISTTFPLITSTYKSIHENIQIGLDPIPPIGTFTCSYPNAGGYCNPDSGTQIVTALLAAVSSSNWNGWYGGVDYYYYNQHDETYNSVSGDFVYPTGLPTGIYIVLIGTKVYTLSDGVTVKTVPVWYDFTKKVSATSSSTVSLVPPIAPIHYVNRGREGSGNFLMVNFSRNASIIFTSARIYAPSYTRTN